MAASKRFLPVFVASLAMFVWPNAFAAEPRISLTPYAGFRMGGSVEDRQTGQNADLEDTASYGLTLGIPWETGSQLEFWYSHQQADISPLAAGTATLDFDTLQLGGTVQFEPRGSAVPFFVFTAGATRVDSTAPGTRADTFPSFSLGGGWQLFPESRVGLRLESRLLGLLVDSSSEVFCGAGPGGGICAFRVNGDMLWQFEINAGLSFRF